MTTKKQVDRSAVRANLLKKIEAQRVWLEEIRKEHPNPRQELDDYVRANFSLEVLLSVARDSREKVDDYDDFTGYDEEASEIDLNGG
jgi:hypothetical protein